MTRREHLKYGLVICTYLVICTCIVLAIVGVVGINLASSQEKLTREETIWPVAHECMTLKRYIEDPSLIKQCDKIVEEWRILYRLKKDAESEANKKSLFIELNKLNSKQE